MKTKKDFERVKEGELIRHFSEDGNVILMYTLILFASANCVVFLDDSHGGVVHSFESFGDADDVAWWR